MAHIVCWRSGEVSVCRRPPKGAMVMITGHGKRLKRVLNQHAQKSEFGFLVIPGVAGTDIDREKIVALKAFEVLLYKELASTPWRNRGGGRLL